MYENVAEYTSIVQHHTLSEKILFILDTTEFNFIYKKNKLH